jgi:hypothetical protein
MSEEIAEYSSQWEEECKAEELKAARQAGKAAVTKKYFNRGYITGILAVCCHMIGKGRTDIAKALLKQYCITRERCKENCIDKLTMEPLEKARVFEGGL